VKREITRHSVTCPQETRAINHHATNNAVWNSPEWKAALFIFKQVHPVCLYCGNPTLTAHHLTLDDYGTPAYIGRYLSQCDPVCASCHWYLHHNYERCSCNAGWRLIGTDHCKNCRPGNEKQQWIDHRKTTVEKTATIRKSINEKTNAARRPYLDAQNQRQREWYRNHKKKK